MIIALRPRPHDIGVPIRNVRKDIGVSAMMINMAYRFYSNTPLGRSTVRPVPNEGFRGV
jgi:hypothetical protein